MAHTLKLSEWQDTTGRWRVADVNDLVHNSAAWWHPARMLDMSLTEYVLLLKDEYKADIDNWIPDIPNTLLTFSWSNENYSYAHKFLLYINRIARNKNWTIC